MLYHVDILDLIFGFGIHRHFTEFHLFKIGECVNFVSAKMESFDFDSLNLSFFLAYVSVLLILN